MDCYLTGPDPVKFTESTEGSGPGLRNLSENDDLSVTEVSNSKTTTHPNELKWYRVNSAQSAETPKPRPVVLDTYVYTWMCQILQTLE